MSGPSSGSVRCPACANPFLSSTRWEATLSTAVSAEIRRDGSVEIGQHAQYLLRCDDAILNEAEARRRNALSERFEVARCK